MSKVREAVQILLEEANRAGPRGRGQIAEEIADTLRREHRTIQQLTVAALIDGLRLYGEEAGTDLRNEAVVSYCEALPEGTFPYI